MPDTLLSPCSRGEGKHRDNDPRRPPGYLVSHRGGRGAYVAPPDGGEEEVWLRRQPSPPPATGREHQREQCKNTTRDDVWTGWIWEKAGCFNEGAPPRLLRLLLLSPPPCRFARLVGDRGGGGLGQRSVVLLVIVLVCRVYSQ